MDFDFEKDLESAPFENNLAEYLDEEELDAIGRDLISIAEQDRDSRDEWMESNKEWLRLATQVMEEKAFPWPGAANIKYPLLTTAAMQFHARALPNLIPDDRPVKAKINGQRQPGQPKQKRADRVGEYMSYQLLIEQEEWLDETDRMLFILPMLGICYRKVYFSSKYGRNKSELILPNDLYINYHAKSFVGATKTHRIPMDPNVLLGLQRQGFFLDVEINLEYDNEDPNDRQSIDMSRPAHEAHDTPYNLYEMECWLDLDGDGYKEPYFVTLDSASGKVLRIVARWKDGDILYNDKGEVAEIQDFSQIVPYIFLPDPVSATSGLGLGTLLGPTNEAVNTILNQLVDAGTLSNLQGGFLSKGVGLRGGATRFRPGEWKVVNSTGDDLRKGVYPMPVQQPSQVLFSLLGTLLNAGEILGSVTDIMVGQNPGQNQKATTSMIVQEQGLAVFSSIYKRIYRGLTKEYRKFYELNFEFLDADKYNMYFDDPNERLDPKRDYNAADLDVVPSADPSTVSDSQRISKASVLMELLPTGKVNPDIAIYKMLEATGQTDIEMLMQLPPPQPSIEEREMALKEKLEPLKLQIALFEAKAKADNLEADRVKKLIEAAIAGDAQALAEAQAMEEALVGRIELLHSLTQNNEGSNNGEQGS